MRLPDDPGNIAADISVAIVDVCLHWRNFKAGHRLDSDNFQCCEVSMEFFKSLDRLQEILLRAAAGIDNALAAAEGINALEDIMKDRCRATTVPGEGRHAAHLCLLKAGHPGSHQWGTCHLCRELP
jgi:hypothetical protein